MECSMESVPRNVVLDLLPAYIAGDASEESRALVESFARKDPQIAALIRAGKIESSKISTTITVPDDLEMRTLKRVRRTIRRQLVYVAFATASILMIPLIAMLFTGDVNWSLFDFIVMGILLFGTGLTYVLISRLSNSIAYRAAVGIAVMTGLLLIWINLAVGIIGSENNPANQLYIGVLAVGIVGAGIARLRPRAMARTLFATALAQMLVPVTAMLIWRPSLENAPGIIGVFILNAFFATLFVVSGMLFRRAGTNDLPAE